MSQLAFAFPESGEKPSIAERFEAFDAENPEVWRLFVAFAEELRAAGRERYSADAILHRIRWHYAVATTREGGFKINDHFSRCYARKLAEGRPAEFGDFFELRKLRSR